MIACAFISVTFAATSCSIAQVSSNGAFSVPEGKSPALESASLGKTRNVHKLGNLYFGGQFEQSDIDSIKSAGISRIISLRTDGEVDWDEQGIVEKSGIEYLAFPFMSPETLTDGVFDGVRKALSDSSKPTLFHCGSASRVGGAWLAYRVLDQKVKLETALKEAKTIGLKSPSVQQKALDYIARNLDAEQSVKPGINKSFKDPNLNVNSFVERFEIESREVFQNREAIVEATGMKPGMHVADVGAGTGLFTRMFSRQVGNEGWVFAVDISPKFIQHINQESAKQGQTNITGVVCAENSINLPPDSVDLIFICDTYHHFEFPSSTLASAHRALKKDGRLVVIDFERIEGKTREWLMNHVRAGKDVFRAEIQDAGFKLVEEKKMDELKENYYLIFSKD